MTVAGNAWGQEWINFDSAVLEARGLSPQVAEYFRAAPRFDAGPNQVELIVNGASVGQVLALLMTRGIYVSMRSCFNKPASRLRYRQCLRHWARLGVRVWPSILLMCWCVRSWHAAGLIAGACRLADQVLAITAHLVPWWCSRGLELQRIGGCGIWPFNVKPVSPHQYGSRFERWRLGIAQSTELHPVG